MDKYLEGLGASDEIKAWFNKRATSEHDLPEQEHIADFFMSEDCPKRFERMTYDEAKRATDKWVKKLNKQAQGIVESDTDTEVALDFGDGFKFVKLVGENAYKREGVLMRHCVASYYGKDDEVYSLRDKENKPHCTISKDSQQIKGKGNGSISPKYIKYVVEFLEYLEVEVRDSEMQNLGYLNIKNDIHLLDAKSREQLFKGKYWYTQNPIKLNDGNNYATFDQYNLTPLLSEVNEVLKCNYDLKTFCEDVHSTMVLINTHDKCMSSASGWRGKSSVSGWNGMSSVSGDYGTSSVSGNCGKSSLSGNEGMSSVSGDYGKSSVSGDEGKSSVSGDEGMSSVSGWNGMSSVSGDEGKSSVSGWNGMSSVSGDCGKSSVSGDYGKSSVSGDYGMSSVSGNEGKSSVSGDEGMSSVSGDESIACVLGARGRAKASLNSWIILTEINDEGHILYIKSAKIDGETLKPDTWYTLKNGEFTEVTTNN